MPCLPWPKTSVVRCAVGSAGLDLNSSFLAQGRDNGVNSVWPFLMTGLLGVLSILMAVLTRGGV